MESYFDIMLFITYRYAVMLVIVCVCVCVSVSAALYHAVVCGPIVTQLYIAGA